MLQVEEVVTKVDEAATGASSTDQTYLLLDVQTQHIIISAKFFTIRLNWIQSKVCT